MPTVRRNGVVKHFPYTPAGRAAAKQYAAMSGGKTVKKQGKKKKSGY